MTSVPPRGPAPAMTRPGLPSAADPATIVQSPEPSPAVALETSVGAGRPVPFRKWLLRLKPELDRERARGQIRMRRDENMSAAGERDCPAADGRHPSGRLDGAAVFGRVAGHFVLGLRTGFRFGFVEPPPCQRAIIAHLPRIVGPRHRRRSRHHHQEQPADRAHHRILAAGPGGHAFQPHVPSLPANGGRITTCSGPPGPANRCPHPIPAWQPARSPASTSSVPARTATSSPSRRTR